MCAVGMNKVVIVVVVLLSAYDKYGTDIFTSSYIRTGVVDRLRTGVPSSM
jgi:hypothetical protein